MRLLCLLSSGIDSPVAAYMVGRGADLVLLHMDNRPFSSDVSLDKVASLRKRLETVLGRELEMHIAPHGDAQAAMRKRGAGQMQCVLCKRLMLRVAERLVGDMGLDGIVIGDSLGQVASQTLVNMRWEQHGIEVPVLRPLIGLDKLEIEAIAKDIGTYEISIVKEGECKAVPKKPLTHVRRHKMESAEIAIDIESLIEDEVRGTVRVP